MRILHGQVLRLGISVAALAAAAGLAATDANAGAFAVREQSAYYQGSSFAGAAAGDDLSSMFWNSAAAAAAPGMNSSTSVSLVVPHTEVTATGGALLNPAFGLERESGDIGDPTVVPASYYNYQLNDQLYLGLAINGGFGFTTKPENLDFAGTPIATTSKIFTLNFNPNVAYKLTDTLTVGVGAQIMYADLRLRSSNTVVVPGPTVVPGRETEVDDWAVGATAGVIWKPMAGTSIGVGYRSAINIGAEGTCTGLGLSNLATLGFGNPGGCVNGAHVTADLTLPDMVTASLSQRLSERWTLLGTVEWTNWSRVGKRAEFKNDQGTIVDVFPLDYKDGWLYSVGLEYAWSPFTKLRGGVGYEVSPIDNAKDRNVSLPDNDRIWLSVGASTKLTDRISVDLAYTHLFVKDASIDTESSLGTLLTAEASGDIDIVSASFKYHWGEPERELEPLK